MSELGPEARALLDAARDADEPTAADRRRVGRALAAALGGAGGAGVSGTASTAAAAKAAGATGSGMVSAAGAASGSVAASAAGISSIATVVTKMVAVAVVGGAVATAVVVAPRGGQEPAPEREGASRQGGAAPGSPSAEAIESPPLPGESPRTVDRAASVDDHDPSGVDAPPAPPHAGPLQGVQRTRRKARAAGSSKDASSGRAPSAPPSQAAEVGALANEIHLLRRAERARRRADVHAALTLLDEHARRFPEGTLRAEARVARVLALCAIDRVEEARPLAQAFLEEFPRSPLASRVRASCAFGP